MERDFPENELNAIVARTFVGLKANDSARRRGKIGDLHRKVTQEVQRQIGRWHHLGLLEEMDEEEIQETLQSTTVV